MPSPQIPDGLWHCLCPSFTPISAIAIATRRLRSRPSLLRAPPKKIACRKAIPIRARSTSAKQHHDLRTPIRIEDSPQPKGLLFNLTWSQRPPEDTRSRTAAVLRVGNNEQLHEELLRRANAGDLAWTRHLVHLLVHERGEQPDIRHYYALIIANTDPALGSVEDVERLLQEMEQCEMTMDASMYHAILKVCTESSFCAVYCPDKF